MEIKKFNEALKNDKDKARNTFLDVVKYFTMFLVIWGHVVQQTCMLDNPFEDYIYQTIYTMHMPLFMGLCGYFYAQSISFYDSIERFVKEKLTMRLKSLIIPMLSIGGVKYILNSAISGMEMNVINYYNAVHGIWFLGDLAINSVIVAFILFLCNGNFKHDWKFFLLGIPFTIIPKLCYSVLGLFMYLFFVTGFFVKFFYRGDLIALQKYWKQVLLTFITCFVIFNILPYEPSSFTYNFRNQTIANVLSIDFFKTLLAYTGSFLMLFLIYKIRPCLNGTWLVKRAVDHGRYTLDIYLLQIIILEMIGGHLYKAYVKETGLDIIHSQGLLFEVVSTFICACIMMEFLVLVSVLINKNYYATKLLFYRDNNK